jgi:hypothetical protein
MNGHWNHPSPSLHDLCQLKLFWGVPNVLKKMVMGQSMWLLKGISVLKKSELPN